MMTDKKQCIRCGRAIDAYARICPFCNWDQNEPVTARAEEQQPETTYVPPAERGWRRYALMGIGGIVLIVGSFALGSIVHGRNPPKNPKGIDAHAQATKPAPHARVTLVPLTGNDTVLEAPITSAPATNTAEGVPPEYQRSDATAVSSAEYAQLAARALAEKKKQKAEVDPRSITGPAYAQGPPPRPPQMSSSTDTNAPASPQTADTSRAESSPATSRTQPVPEYQPVPDIQVSNTSVVRLQLMIGADGRVHEVNVLQSIPGQTSKIVSAVQQWRFKPATENGNPVSAPFTVDLSFKGNE